MQTSTNLVAILGFHEGNAGQVAEWFESVTGLQIDCFFCTQETQINVDATAENAKRISQRMSYPMNGFFKGKPFFCSEQWISILRNRGVHKLLLLESDNFQRLGVLKNAVAHGFELISAIHPTAVLLDDAIVHPGVWINARAVVGYKSEIYPGAMINTGAIVEHHCILESCCQVDPGAVLGGHVTLRTGSHVHLGACIVNRIEIGEGAVVGAGSLVRANVAPHSTVVGVPAHPLIK